MAKSLVLDTSFWIALYNDGDRYHRHAFSQLPRIEKGDFSILMPWPIFYEVLRTKFIKRKIWVQQFAEHLSQLKIHPLDDSLYRQSALRLTIQYAVSGKRPISLADMVIRLALEDPNHKIDHFVTYNPKDFFDVCQKRRIQMYYENIT